MPKPTDIELSVNLSTADIKESADKLSKSIKDIFDKSAGKALDSKLKSLQSKMSSTASKTNKVVEEMKKLENTKLPTTEYQEISKWIDQLQTKLSKIQETQDKFIETGGNLQSTTYKRMQYDVAQLSNSLEYARGELQDLVDSGKAFTLGINSEEYSKLSSELANLNNQQRINIERYNEQSNKTKQSSKTTRQLTQAVSDLASKFAQLANSIKSKVISTINNFVSVIKKLGLSFKSLHKNHDLFNFNLKKGIWTVLKYGLGIRSLYVLFNKLRSAVSEGIKNFVLWEGQNGKTNKSLSMLSSSLATLKNSIGTVAVPLINALVPALNTIIQLFIKATNAVGMFIAVITGQKTFTKANAVQKDFATSLDKTASSAKKAEKALKGYLSPLDEINQYSSETDNDSGGGGGGIDMGGFSDVPISTAIKDAWANADFTEIGKELGDKLAEALANIDWNNIKRNAWKLGKSLATFINGFIQSEFDGKFIAWWIGHTLAEAVNTAFWFLRAFITNLDVFALGKAFVDLIKGALESIDWNMIYSTLTLLGLKIGQFLQAIFSDPVVFQEIGEAIASAINSGASFALSLILNAPWENIGTRLGELVNSLANKINPQTIFDVFVNIFNGLGELLLNLVTTIEWEAIASKLAESLNRSLSNLDIATMAEGISTFLDNLLQAIIIFMEEVDWNLVGQKIGEFISNIDWSQLVIDVKNLVSAIVQAISDTLNSWGESSPISKGIFSIILGVVSSAFVIGEITKVIKSIKGVIDIVKDFKVILDNLGILSKITKVSGGVILVISGIIMAVTNAIKIFKDGWNTTSVILQTIGIVIAAIGAVILGVPATVAAVVAAIIAVVLTLVEAIYTHWEDIKKWCSDLWKNITDGFKRLGENIKSGIDSIKKHFQTFGQNVKKIWNDIWDGIKNIINKILGGIESMINHIISGINKLIGLLNKVSFDVPDWIPGIGGKNFGFNISTLGNVSIPRLAQGAVIPPNNEFMAMLGDQKQGTNIETPLDTMIQAFKTALQDMGGTSGVQTINFLLPDKKVVAQYAIEGGQILQVSKGRNPFDLL